MGRASSWGMIRVTGVPTWAGRRCANLVSGILGCSPCVRDPRDGVCRSGEVGGAVRTLPPGP
eukprot:8681179-Pyramimonas_sp.AAC.1